MIAWLAAIRRTPIASDTDSVAGRPSGTSATITPRANTNVATSGCPLGSRTTNTTAPISSAAAATRRAIAATWNAAIAAAAATHGATLVDLYQLWPLTEHPEYIGQDRLHPTTPGYHALAETFHQVLERERIV